MDYTLIRASFEIIWTLAAAIGLFSHGVGAWQAIADLQVLKARGLNSLREEMARGNRYREIHRGAKQLFFLAVGLWSWIFIPNYPMPLTGFEWFFSVGMVAVELDLTWLSVADRVQRRRLIQKARALREAQQRRATDLAPEGGSA